MVKKEDMQGKIMSYQMLESNLQALREREAHILRSLEDLQRTKSAIKDLENTEANDSLIPLGGGVFIPGKVTDTNNVIVSVGGGIAVKKTREGAVDTLDARVKEVENVLAELEGQLHNISDQLQRLQLEIQKASE